MNFFLDTPIITEITLEARTNIYDMISAVGGTLGLFTGISVITFFEVVYWIGKFLEVGIKMLLIKYECLTKIFDQSENRNKHEQESTEDGLGDQVRKNSIVKSSFM